jgi:hypothetical protein
MTQLRIASVAGGEGKKRCPAANKACVWQGQRAVVWVCLGCDRAFACCVPSSRKQSRMPLTLWGPFSLRPHNFQLTLPFARFPARR